MDPRFWGTGLGKVRVQPLLHFHNNKKIISITTAAGSLCSRHCLNVLHVLTHFIFAQSSGYIISPILQLKKLSSKGKLPQTTPNKVGRGTPVPKLSTDLPVFECPPPGSRQHFPGALSVPRSVQSHKRTELNMKKSSLQRFYDHLSCCKASTCVTNKIKGPFSKF